jgi:O-antigen ligase
VSDPRPVPDRFLDSARAAAALLLGGLLVLRLLWTGVTFPESDAFVSVAALAILAALLAAVGCAGGAWRLRAPADGGALLYLLVLVALSLAAPRRWLARGVLLQAIACTAAYLVAANAAVSRRARLLLCAAFMTGTLAVSLYGLYQHFQGLAETRAAFAAAGGALADPESAFAVRLRSGAVFSTFFYPNALAGFLVVAIPFAASIPLLRREDASRVASAGCLGLLAAATAAWAFLPGLRGKPLLFAGLFLAASALAAGVRVAELRAGRVLRGLLLLPPAALAVWTLALTASEGAWLSLAAACVLGPLLLSTRLIAAAALLLALAVLFAALLLTGTLPDGLARSLDVRMDYWRAAAAIWRGYPLAGMGPGTFAGAYPAFRSPGSEEGRMAHSAYLGLAAETGAAGLAAFLAMAGLWLVALRARAREGEPLAAAAFVAVCAFLLHNAGDVGLTVPGTTFALWYLAGLGAGASLRPGERRRLSGAAGIALAVLVLAAAAGGVVPRARAEVCRLSAERLAGAGRHAEALAEMERALAAEPDNADYWLRRAAMEAPRGGDAQALPSYARAASLGRGIPRFHFQHAICLWRLSGAGADPRTAAAAIAELREAVRCNPHDPDYRLLLGHWLEITGQGEASLLEYRRGLALVETARAKPHRTRRHGPAALERLRAAVIAKLEEGER